jgi:hexokinase
MRLVDKFSMHTLFYICLALVNIAHATRSEEGIYYAIDIGGTCFRFLKVELGAGSTIINQKVDHQPIKEELTKGTSEVCLSF